MPEPEGVIDIETGGVRQAPKPKYVVWYGSMAFVGEFDSKVSDLAQGTHVVVRSPRGTELGKILCPSDDRLDPEFKNAGHILRVATESDVHRQSYIDKSLVPTEAIYCRARIEERKLPMKIVGVDHLFGGDKIVFYFLAEGRVDFRDLVRDLAKRFETRIELTQIGVRDEARLLGDYNYCGRPLCCRTFMKRLETVTMKMAKNQKATLDPSKISGRCGRLMCCLRFENEVYAEFKKKLPKKGSHVQAGNVSGKVIKLDVLQQTVTMAVPNTGTVTVAAEETKVIPKDQLAKKAASPESKSPQRRGNRPPQSEPAAKKPASPESKSPQRRDNRPPQSEPAAKKPASPESKSPQRRDNRPPRSKPAPSEDSKRPSPRPDSDPKPPPSDEGTKDDRGKDGDPPTKPSSRSSRRRRSRSRRNRARRENAKTQPDAAGGASGEAADPQPQRDAKKTTPKISSAPTEKPDLPSDEPATDHGTAPDWMNEAQDLRKTSQDSSPGSKRRGGPRNAG